MAEYDELVKDLRENHDKYFARDMQAADAIEELSRAADAIPHVCECCIGCEVESGGCDNAFVLSPKRAKEYLSKPSWIPVTERLPKEAGKYLVCGRWRGEPTEIWVCEFMTLGCLNGWANNAANPVVSHWMTLPKPPKEE